MALRALHLPETSAAQAEFFRAHRELVEETIQGLAKVREEHADEVASLRNMARVPWDHARHSNDPILAHGTDGFAPKFSDYRYEDGPPYGEARFSDYRYSPEHAGDRSSDYQVTNHDHSSERRIGGSHSVDGLRGPAVTPRLQSVDDTRSQEARNPVSQQRHRFPVLPSDSQTPLIEVFNFFGVYDPCYEVLPATLLKYYIQADWRLYDLYIVYGDQERCVGLDEKPLALWREMDSEGKGPRFMLKKALAAVVEARGASTTSAGNSSAPPAS